MTASLANILRLSPQEKSDLGGLAARLRTVSEFLSEALPKAGKMGFAKAIEDSLPWVGAAVDAGVESFGSVKFVVTLFSKLTALREPEELAELACTLAYERSIEQAVKALDLATLPDHVSDAALARFRSRDGVVATHDGLSKSAASSKFNVERLSFAGALLHPFVLDCDAVLGDFAAAAGYSKEQSRALQNEVHQRFVSNLKTLLCHGDTREKFASVRERMSVGTGDATVYETLADHAEYQRWLFEEQRIFGKEPFSLQEVYQETDCGELTWREIRDQSSIADDSADDTEQSHVKHRVDPFSEEWGGRKQLRDAVLDRLGDQNFRDAIVIQGTAGAGKSAFTLWLCRELVWQGLRPIRVLLRDVRLDQGLPLSEALSMGIRTSERGYPGKAEGLRPDDLLPRQVFRDQVRFGTAEICPYVLILDGWDEISLSVSEGFRLRVARMLEALRREYIDRPGIPIRVILTGRPTLAVTGASSEAPAADSTFLKSQTPVLTIRPLKPEQVEDFVARVAQCVSRAKEPLIETGWRPFEVARFNRAFAKYRSAFFDAQGGAAQSEDAAPKDKLAGLEVLGLPLLLHLSTRLLSNPQVDVGSTIANPTGLFRQLVDLTCAKAGKYVRAIEDIDNQERVAGERLRELLRWTAAAVTVVGSESISYGELFMRLRKIGLDLAERVESGTEHSLLSQLMVSYYFKGGRHELGCEFLHKSFREYLFAEGLVEILKRYGWATAEAYPRFEREPYWRDFDLDDSRRLLSRDLALQLAPQWLSREVSAHLDDLIGWEISRTSATTRNLGPEVGHPTSSLSLAGWRRVRDGLADLWDWWAEGVHQRPQPHREGRNYDLSLLPAFAEELVQWSMPHAVPRHRVPVPRRMTEIDSHLGGALFQLTAWVHFRIAVHEGWIEGSETLPRLAGQLWEGISSIGCGPRRCQTEVRQGELRFQLFSPGGKSPSFFRNYVARINAAGWRRWPFPRECDFRGVDLRGVELPLGVVRGPDIPIPIDLRYTNLAEADLTGGLLDGANLRFAHAPRASFLHATLLQADLRDAWLVSANFDFADIRGASLGNAVVDRSRLLRADLEHANCSFASFDGADLRGASLRSATLKGASFVGCNLSEADLRSANLSDAALADAILTPGYPAGLAATVDASDEPVAPHSQDPSFPSPRTDDERATDGALASRQPSYTVLGTARDPDPPPPSRPFATKL